jgi:hypothetical protein
MAIPPGAAKIGSDAFSSRRVRQHIVPFNFKTNQQEENGHQAVVNPVFHAIFQLYRTELDTHFEMPKSIKPFPNGELATMMAASVQTIKMTPDACSLKNSVKSVVRCVCIGVSQLAHDR